MQVCSDFREIVLLLALTLQDGPVFPLLDRIQTCLVLERALSVQIYSDFREIVLLLALTLQDGPVFSAPSQVQKLVVLVVALSMLI
ncbi:hypothetical protein GCM10020370_28810 [Paenibacillus hodogayensis]